MKSDRRPQRRDLVIPQKTSKCYELEFLTDGYGEDITNFTIYFVVKANYNDTDDNATLKKKITTHEDAAAGQTLIELSASDTDLIKGDYRYEISYVDGDGIAEVIFTGRLTITKTILQTRY